MCICLCAYLFVCVCVCVCTLASLRVRLKGERTPELLLELQNDERSQSFLSQVKKAKQQGECNCNIVSPVCLYEYPSLSLSPSPFPRSSIIYLHPSLFINLRESVIASRFSGPA